MSELLLDEDQELSFPAEAPARDIPVSHAHESARAVRWSWIRRPVQVVLFLLFLAPPLLAGWGLFGMVVGGDDPSSVPRDLLFSGTLTSSHIAGITLLDPFAVIQMAAASKTFLLDWLLFAAPVLIFYGLIRGRVFCGWVCPVNFLVEIIDGIRRKLGKPIGDQVLPRHVKVWVAVGVIVLSLALSVPVFEAFNPISAINKGIVLGATTGLAIFAAVLILEVFWGHRLWCRSLCPLGGFYEVIGKVGLLNVRMDHDACIQCGACKKVCLADPGILDPALEGEDAMVRAGDCLACGACVEACPTQALAMKLGRVSASETPET